MSRRAARRRALAAPYQTDKGVDSILEFMKRSERQLEQQQSEQQFLALLQQQSSSIDGVLILLHKCFSGTFGNLFDVIAREAV